MWGGPGDGRASSGAVTAREGAATTGEEVVVAGRSFGTADQEEVVKTEGSMAGSSYAMAVAQVDAAEGVAAVVGRSGGAAA